MWNEAIRRDSEQPGTGAPKQHLLQPALSAVACGMLSNRKVNLACWQKGAIETLFATSAQLILSSWYEGDNLPRAECPTAANLWGSSSAERNSGVASESHRHHQPGGRKSLQIQPARSTWRQPALLQEHSAVKTRRFVKLSSCLRRKPTNEAVICVCGRLLVPSSFVSSVLQRPLPRSSQAE